MAPNARWKSWLNRLRRAPQGNFLASIGKERKFLRRAAYETKPDVILAHFGDMALRVLPIATPLGIPLVAHFHGLDLSSLLRNKWYRWSLKAALPKLSAAVVVGSRQREVLLGFGMQRDKIHLIPCGVPTDEFVPNSNYQARETVRFICVSRLAPFKGVDESIRAFSEVRKSYPESSLIIVGDGPEMESLTGLVARLGLSDSVTFKGALSSERVRQLLGESDIFLQHSLNGAYGEIEGFGVTVAEASATGLPVVCTRCGGIVDQVVDGETGTLVEQHDVSQMAKAMLRLAHQPELRHQMGRAGRERAVQRYDTSKQVAKLEDVLCSVVKK